jgi:ATP-dependent RNA helicase DeaD
VSFSQFDLLPQSIKALDKQGITIPTPIQQQAIPPLLDSQDVIGQAKTGSGKTLAFALPMLEFVEPNKRWVQALVVTPTRELANQIVEVVDSLGRADGVRVLPVFGGRSIGPQISQLKRGVHILVATPGRLKDLINRGAVSLDRVVYAVIDEADEMLDQGFARDVEFILGKLKNEHVTALFSATMPDWVHQASKKYLHEPVTVTVDPLPEDEPKISHYLMKCPADRRMTALCDLLDGAGDGSSIVFGRTKHGVKKLAKKLIASGYAVGCLQGNMSQNARDRAMQDFRDKRVSILVATNVAARGLDVDHVELVVNYELPENAELLTHRIGRTGRMGREGAAYTLITEDDSKKWNKLRRDFKHNMESVRWPLGDSRSVKKTRPSRLVSTPSEKSREMTSTTTGRRRRRNHSRAH